MRAVRLDPPSSVSPAVKAMTAFLALALPLVAYAERGLTAPKGIDLTGVWTIDRERSDDPEKPREPTRKEGKAPIRVHVGGVIGALGGVSGVGGGVSGGMGGPGERHPDRNGGREGREGMDEGTPQLFAASERMEILQLPDSVDLKFADHYVSCTSAAKTQMTLSGGGAADRTCGWDGDEFIVEIEDADGHMRTDRISRGDDDTLVVKTTVTGERVPKREFKRVYMRSDSN